MRSRRLAPVRAPCRRACRWRHREPWLDDIRAAGRRLRMMEFWAAVYVFMLASFVGLGVIRRVSRLLHTPLMSITNTTSAIAVVGSVLVAGGDYPSQIRTLGAIAICASMSHIVSGLLSRYRMLKLCKARELRVVQTYGRDSLSADRV